MSPESRNQSFRRRGGIRALRAVRADGQAGQQQPGEEPGVVEHVKAGQVAGRVPAELVRRVGQARSGRGRRCAVGQGHVQVVDVDVRYVEVVVRLDLILGDPPGQGDPRPR